MVENQATKYIKYEDMLETKQISDFFGPTTHHGTSWYHGLVGHCLVHFTHKDSARIETTLPQGRLGRLL